MTRFVLSIAVVTTLALAGAAAALAATPLAALRYVPDMTADLGGTIVDHNQVAEDNLAGVVTLVDIGAIPSAAIVTAYDVLDDGDQLLAFDIDVALPGGLTVRPGDVVRFDGSTFTVLFSAADHGIPRGVIVDAVAAIGPNDLLLSFDVPVALGPITAFGRDIVRVHDGAVELFFDGAAAGVAAGLDLDALHCIPSNGHLLISFDGSGVLGGVPFRANDVLEYDPSSATWELAYDAQAEHPGWYGADLQAVSATTDPPDTIATPVIGDPATDPPDTNTIVVGSRRISGRGTARAKPNDTCIQIWDVGPNGHPDTPPGGGDDLLLGTGGTDAAGNFVGPDGTPGIPISSPLRDGQRIVAVDVCANLRSAVVLVTVTQAPLLSTSMLLVSMLVLFGVCARGLFRTTI